MVVFPYTQIMGADTASRFHGRSLGDDQPGPSDRPTAEMHQMPVSGKTVFARILAHGRNSDPVPKRYITNLQFIEQHGNTSLKRISHADNCLS
jgi:hypothetical protein